MSKIKEKSKKSIVKLIFSRTLIVTVLLLIEIALILASIIWLGNNVYLLIGGGRLTSFVMIIYLINNRQNSNVKLVWIILILLVPFFGICLYWFIKFDFGSRMMKNRIVEIQNQTKNVLVQKQEIINNLRENKLFELRNIAKYIKKTGGYNIYQDSEIKYYSLGEYMFFDMLIALKNATKFIFLEYFIIEHGKMWDSILEILKQKVLEGVEVRVMYDGTCEYSTLDRDYPRELMIDGIKAQAFSPVKPFVSTHYNNRNHRKIMVIDGEIAFTGGVNLADEYINEVSKFGHWKDTGIRIMGDGVKPLTLMFLQSWNIFDYGSNDYSKYVNVSHDIKNDGYIIAYGDEPFDDELLGQNIYIDILNNAKEYVYIMTPYLIIDNEMLAAIKLAAIKGVDVKIILPHIADKEMPFALAHNHYSELIDSGVKVYEYTPGFVHGKMFVSDDIKAVVGTINLDYRSLYHHFENAVYMYNVDAIKDIKNDFIETFKKSQIFTNRDLKEDKLLRKLIGKLMKIFAPLI
ncbi:cardiolipin synthase [Streptobacillus moniliformis]|uniref:Cardiolipin synthase n=1 Tax=Streptobacillus moniliformis (strain ATCC 14647 / DSM 12112 / NCTC 10651 / 9901) TaxID=519441 RepID=D1AVT8_STRM9|nr:cardiolipin synthase [Streptobacillus moniliformis]ACZ01848.1 phospholipase D/Transphosphatidylase [Streptobacillus moniliformis DSM 12112]AVL43158.1 cardiolipin synthase [Streptobacillus moniliformis]SQA12948.1 Cardiolipin synthase [Streptobacillus moniliformis]